MPKPKLTTKSLLTHWVRLLAVFVAACREGRKLEAQQVKSSVVAWFEWARQQRIVKAMSGEVVYTPEGEAVELLSMMRRYPVRE
ncbi:hypothetical protein WKK05_14570 [Nostoc sp. UHCC 0302]|uniref:hypothetical protein n=1 Tax=Nostoc sp. UHCC 0302 TaxID=3134896 RepID=UPI00311CD4D8